MISGYLRRKVLFCSGLLAIAVIVLAQSFYKISVSVLLPKNSEKQTEQTSKPVISAPSEVIANGHTLTVEGLNAMSLENAFGGFQTSVEGKQLTEILNSFFKTLFSIIISPNAP